MIPLTKYLAYPPHTQTAREIILWWESRRLIYNGIIFAAILLSALLLATVMQPKRFTEYLSRAGTLVATGFSVLQIPANLWYMGGWAADLFVKRVLRLSAARFGPWALACGTAFSLLFIGLLVTGVFSARSSNRDNPRQLPPLLAPFGARGPSRFMKAFLALAMMFWFGFQLVMGILFLPILLLVRMTTRRRSSPIRIGTQDDTDEFESPGEESEPDDGEFEPELEEDEPEEGEVDVEAYDEGEEPEADVDKRK